MRRRSWNKKRWHLKMHWILTKQIIICFCSNRREREKLLKNGEICFCEGKISIIKEKRWIMNDFNKDL